MNDASGRAGLTRSVLKLGEVEIELYQGGSGPPLLFLHGGSGLDPAAPFLAALSQRFRVVAPVHPGFGGSSLPIWINSVDDFAHLYLELIATARTVRRPAGRPFDRRLDRSRDRDQEHGAIDKLVLVAPVGIKVGPVDKLDIPDIYAMPQDQIDRLLYADPDKWRPDRRASLRMPSC